MNKMGILLVGACVIGGLLACGSDDADDSAGQLTCGAGTHLEANVCRADAVNAPQCGAGTQLVGNECVPAETIACGTGTKRVGDECVPTSPLACGPGTHEDGGSCIPDQSVQVTKAVLGKLIYFDTNLSSPPGQSCASCHAPDSGFADPDRQLPVSQGVKPWLFGNRNSPTCAYMGFSPEFHFDATEGLYVGGQFWDGRAKNLVEQAKGPFLNPLEMATADEAALVTKVAASEYKNLFEKVFGAGSLNDTASAYTHVAEALAAYEESAEVNRFSSKFDHVRAGKATFTAQEQHGLELFDAPDRGNCAACHTSTGQGSTPALFTDFTYDNLGVPKNIDNPFLKLGPEHNPDGTAFVDLGLGGVLKEPAQNGKFKVPTLRNVALTAPYMHNGLFKTLKEVVDFYNTRDLGGFPPPEVPENVNVEEMGNLGLTEQEVLDIVAFMETLTDGYVPPSP